MIRNSEYLICYDAGRVGKTRDFVAMERVDTRHELG